MDLAERKAKYTEIMADADPKERGLVERLIEEICWDEERMDELRRLPFLAVHPKKPHIQKATPAARQYRDIAASYMNALRILLNILRKVQSSAADELLRQLAEFDNE